jgi:hypothetical protein
VPWRSVVANAIHGPHFDPNDADGDAEMVIPDHDAAVGPFRVRRLRRNYPPRHQASRVKSPYRSIAFQRPAFVQRGFCGGFAPHKPLIRFSSARISAGTTGTG